MPGTGITHNELSHRASPQTSNLAVKSAINETSTESESQFILNWCFARWVEQKDKAEVLRGQTSSAGKEKSKG